MKRIQFVGCGVALLLSIVGIGAQVGTARLEQAVRQQCVTHDWPNEAHEAHIDWCSANGYAVE